MSRALYLSGLRLGRVGLISWSVGLALIGLWVVSIYPSIREATGFQGYLEAMPEVMKVAIGAEDEGLALMFTNGQYDYRAWLNTEYLSWAPLMLGFYAVFYCSGLVSREIERGTMDMLLSQPLRRSTFLLTKLMTFSTLVSGVAAASFLALAAGSAFLDVELSLWYLAEAHIVSILIVLAIAGYSTLASCLLLDPRKSLAAAGIVTVALYFLNILGPSMGSLSWLQKASLFYYYDSLKILFRGDINEVGLAVYIGVAVVAVAASLYVFQRRDILK